MRLLLSLCFVMACQKDAGESVSAGGDVNGGGYDDLLIGALGDSTTGAYAGAAYLLFAR